MSPLDPKSLFQTLDEMKDLGEQNSKAFTYYEGMEAFCVETNKSYRWQEVLYGYSGLLNVNFTYPPNTVVDGKDYSGKSFNFISQKDGAASDNLFYLEPSVNIEIKDEEVPEQAMYFGTLDIGFGVQDVALVKNNFVSQSGFEILSQANIGAEIKITNATRNQYLGHFLITNDVFSGYRILTIIEKGDWSFLSEFNIQQIVIHVLKSAQYTFSLSGTNIVLKQGNQTISTQDIGPLLPTTNTATILNASLNENTGIVTFNLSDSTNFTLNLSALLVSSDYISKNGVIAVKGKDIYENLFVTNNTNASYGVGFYASDLTTNYNSINFAGFPYPANRDYIVCRYSNYYFLLVKKTITNGSRLLLEPNNVLALSFFKFRGTDLKSLGKVAYFKIKTRKVLLTGLNSSFYAYPIIAQDFPGSNANSPFNEIGLSQLDEPLARPLINLCYRDKMSLKVQVTAPFVLSEEYNGLEIYISGSGNVTIPELPFGFDCEFIQDTNSDISFVAASGVVIYKSSNYEAKINARYEKVKLSSYTTYNPIAATQETQNSYLLTGNLRPITIASLPEKIRNSGWFSGVDVNGGNLFVSYLSGGDVILARRTEESGSMDIIEVTVNNAMDNLNYQVIATTETLGNPQQDNDIKSITFNPISTTKFYLYLEEDASVVQNLRIHLQVIQN